MEWLNLSEKVKLAIQTSINRLDKSQDAHEAIAKTLEAIGEVLSHIGIIAVSLISYNSKNKTLRYKIVVREGKEVSLDGTVLDRDWSVDQETWKIPWNRMQKEDFLWGLTCDPTVLIPEIRAYYEADGAIAVAYQPLRRDQKIFGWITISWRSPQPPAPEQIQLIQVLAAYTSLVIEMARLTKFDRDVTVAQEQEIAAEQRAIELAKVNDIMLGTLNRLAIEQEKAALERVAQLAQANNTLKKTLDVLATEPKLNSALDRIFQVTIEQLGSSSAALWLYKPDLDQFRLHLIYLDGKIITAISENAHLLTDIWINGQNLSRDLGFKEHIEKRTPVIYDVDSHPAISKLASRFLNKLNIKTLLGIPLLLGSEVIGSYTIRFSDQREFQAEELELIQALAHQATLAIKLLQMAEEAKNLAILEERNRLAGEIHDTLAQAFTGISIQTGVAKEILERDPIQTQQILDHISTLSQTGLAEARRSVWALHSSAAEYADLVHNLQHYFEQFKHITTQVEVKIEGTPSLVSPAIGKNLLRIAQEAVNNAMKHANATTIRVKLTCEVDFLGLEIRDNGCGFELSSDRDGFGLISMTERAERIGGQILITSELDKGTVIQVYAPLA